VQGYDGMYEVSNTGYVRSLERLLPGRHGCVRRVPGRVLAGQYNTYGYIQVGLTASGGERRCHRVHRLVAVAFLGDGGGLEVNHIDLDKTNNKVENLEWVTKLQNAEHAVKAGRYNPYTNPNQARKLTAASVADIRTRAAAGEKQQTIADDHGIHQSLVSRIHNQETWAPGTIKTKPEKLVAVVNA